MSIPHKGQITVAKKEHTTSVSVSTADQELNGTCRHAMLRLFPNLKVNKDVDPRDACYIAAKTLYSQLRHYACDKITYIILCNNAGLYIHITLENIPIPRALTS